MKTKLFLVAVLGTLLFSSCAKKTTPPDGGTTSYADSYTINGPGFNNANYYMTSISGQTSSFSSPTTTIDISGHFGDSVRVLFNISLTGSTAATYQMGAPGSSPNNMQVTRINDKTSNQTIYSSQSGSSLIITSYGGVGSAVTGTFSGKFQDDVGNSYTISNGTFSATRVN